MKIGFDIHGVIDKYPLIFRELSLEFKDLGHEVHIVTGSPRSKCEQYLKDIGIHYDEYFSIVDYHKSRENPEIYQDDDGNWWMDDALWNKSKGDYAFRVGLDLHFDDCKEYMDHFPDECSTILVRDNFLPFIKMVMEMGGMDKYVEDNGSK